MTAFKDFTPSIVATVILTVCGLVGMTKTAPAPVTVNNVIGSAVMDPQVTIYGAEWCAPCKVYKKAVKEKLPAAGFILKDASDKDAALAHIVFETSKEVIEANGIDSIPCTIFRKGGNEVRRVTGAISPDSLAKQYNEIGMKP